MPRIFLVSRTVLGTGMQAVLQRGPNNDIRVLNCAEPEQILLQLKDFRPELSIWDETSFPVLTQLFQSSAVFRKLLHYPFVSKQAENKIQQIERWVNTWPFPKRSCGFALEKGFFS